MQVLYAELNVNAKIVQTFLKVKKDRNKFRKKFKIIQTHLNLMFLYIN